MIARTELRSTRIDLNQQTRDQIVETQNALLATYADLYSQLKQAHWNLRGPGFIALHELFDKLAGEVTGHIDATAERLAQLGGLARGTVRDAANSTSLPEYPESLTDEKQTLAVIAAALAKATSLTRTGIDTAEQLNDAVTADLLTQIAADLDKALWFVEAHSA